MSHIEAEIAARRDPYGMPNSSWSNEAKTAFQDESRRVRHQRDINALNDLWESQKTPAQRHAEGEAMLIGIFVVFPLFVLGILAWIYIEKHLAVFKVIGSVVAVVGGAAFLYWLFSAINKWRKTPSKKQAAAMHEAYMNRRRKEAIDELARTVAARQNPAARTYSKPVAVNYTITPS